MSTLDQQLARTFRAARWAASDGFAVCKKCFDGLDLQLIKQSLPNDPSIWRYRCAVCRWEFSDLTDTVFATSKPVTLSLWAYLVLLGDPGVLLERTQQFKRRMWELSAKIKGRPLTITWREQLEGYGITAEKLRKYLDRQRRTT